jgi:anhydro-N-acetylmuramic acid kinase
VLATLAAFTAQTVADALARFAPAGIEEVIVSGGGVSNGALMENLSWTLWPAWVRPSSVYGIPPMAKEAAAFALFAAQAISRKVNTAPSATGASRGVVAGKIVPGRPT